MGRVVRGAKCPWGELSMGRIVRGANCPWGKMSVGRNVRGAKCPWDEISWGELSWGELSWGEWSGNRPSTPGRVLQMRLNQLGRQATPVDLPPREDQTK
jgi:hypothetical protein